MKAGLMKTPYKNKIIEMIGHITQVLEKFEPNIYNEKINNFE
jgi:hypothetical protein